MREEFEHEHRFTELNTLARVIAGMVERGEPVSDELKREYRSAYARWERSVGRSE